jgi:AcrR family transcriptional regulator
MSETEREIPSVNRPLIWFRAERAVKGPAPSKTRDEVAAAAVTLADEGGLDAASMRKVAAALGVGAASIYRYVDGRDELYDLMVDRVEGEDGPPPPVSGDWRADLTVVARRTRALIHRHPWLASVAAGRPSFGPNSVAWTEHGLACMAVLDIDIDEMFVASEVLQSFVLGFTTRELSEHEELRRSGVSADQRGRSVASWVEALIGSGAFPHFARVVRDASLPHAARGWDVRFDRGLDLILDGLFPDRR